MKTKLFVLLLSLFSLSAMNQSNAQQEGMIGEVKMFAGTYAPRGWMLCEGQILAISSNSALFSILGTTYGGDGRTTFALPDLRGRVPMGNGSGQGLSPTTLGRQNGQETTTLTINNLPSHNHTIETEQKEPVEIPLPRESQEGMVPLNHTTGTSATQTGNTGNNLPVNNMQPTLTLNYIICVNGTYPSRN